MGCIAHFRIIWKHRLQSSTEDQSPFSHCTISYDPGTLFSPWISGFRKKATGTATWIAHEFHDFPKSSDYVGTSSAMFASCQRLFSGKSDQSSPRLQTILDRAILYLGTKTIDAPTWSQSATASYWRFGYHHADPLMSQSTRPKWLGANPR